MKTSLLLAALALASAAPAGYAQFGSGIVFDPTQSYCSIRACANLC